MSSVSDIINKSTLLFIIKFIGIFCILYFGTIAFIGLTVPGGYYSPFIAEHLNYIDWIRNSLLFATKEVLSWFGYQTYMPAKYELFVKGGYGIRMVYSCIGYGVMSFWAAFIIANKGSLLKKIYWLTGGWLAIWIINVLRLTILVIALNKNWTMPLGLDHHTWFNIVAYSLIFLMIWLYDRSSSKPKLKSNNSK